MLGALSPRSQGSAHAAGEIQSTTGEFKMTSHVLGMRPSFLANVFLAGCVWYTGPAMAQAPSPSALSGKVNSQEEGAMEGVLVSAKRAGSPMTITVVSDASGQYSFPRER